MIHECKEKWENKVIVSTPSKGNLTFKWAYARYHQRYPLNWGFQGFDWDYPVLGYNIDDAYNLVAKVAIESKSEWLIVVEDDVILPDNFFISMNEYIKSGEYPIVSGLYYSKSRPSEPLILRGRGNGVYEDWKDGDKVKCDGFGFGCMLIHMSLIKWMWDHTPEHKNPDGVPVHRIFATPGQSTWDIKQDKFMYHTKTQDLHFFDTLTENDVYEKTGWKVDKENPLLCDTSIKCGHIDIKTGKVY